MHKGRNTMDSYEKFVFDLKRQFNIDLTGYKRPQMERRINALMRTFSISAYDSFISAMKEDNKLLERFVEHLTINVSEFFRNASQWQVLEKKILPTLPSRSSQLKIWSAGCSTGEEPYTIAMLLSENLARSQFSILATDFDNRVLQKASEGIYTKKAAAGIPEEYLWKYFKPVNEGYQVLDSLKKSVAFRRHNLLRDPFPEQMDLIVCRNVVIYFTEETKALLYKKLFQALKPGGVLFTGSTEQILQFREIGFESLAIFFYRRPV